MKVKNLSNSVLERIVAGDQGIVIIPAPKGASETACRSKSA